MRMKRIVFLIVVTIPLLLAAQSNSSLSGIKWIEGLSWSEIKQKAKEENKFIFIDCYATWCVPCKKMDREVYDLMIIGDSVNPRFISAKLQIDTTKFDDVNKKNWYAVAQKFKTDFSLHTLPAYLFFSPNGDIVHKAYGYKDPIVFNELLREAINPETQYYTLISRYKTGTKDYKIMGYLAKLAKDNGDKDISSSIAKDYMENHLLKLHKDSLFSKEYLSFIIQFTKSSKEKTFFFLHRNADSINRVLGGDDYVESLISSIIGKEEVFPIMQKAKKLGKEDIDWNLINLTIKKKYGTYYANRIITWAKVSWFGYKRDWVSYTKYLVLAVENSSARSKASSYFINNNAYDIFERSTDEKELFTAIGWMEALFKNDKREINDGSSLDTYANLLYKVGRVGEAIKWQEKAVSLDPENKEIKEHLNSMQSGVPTWPIN